MISPPARASKEKQGGTEKNRQKLASLKRNANMHMEYSQLLRGNIHTGLSCRCSACPSLLCLSGSRAGLFFLDLARLGMAYMGPACMAPGLHCHESTCDKPWLCPHLSCYGACPAPRCYNLAEHWRGFPRSFPKLSKASLSGLAGAGIFNDFDSDFDTSCHGQSMCTSKGYEGLKRESGGNEKNVNPARQK